MNTSITARRIGNRSFSTCITALVFTGVVIATPPATASIPAPDPGSTTSAPSFDIGEYVAQCKTQMAQDWVDRASDRAAAGNQGFEDIGDVIARAKAQMAQGRGDGAGSLPV